MGQNRAAFAGQIADVPVPELIRTVTAGEGSGVVHFETTLGSATLWFSPGALVDADMGRFHMEAAVERLARVENGTFEVEYKPISRPSLIKTPLDELLARIEGTESGARRIRKRRRQTVWRPTAGGQARAAQPDPPEQVSKPAPPSEPRPETATPIRAVRSTDLPVAGAWTPPAKEAARPTPPAPARSDRTVIAAAPVPSPPSRPPTPRSPTLFGSVPTPPPPTPQSLFGTTPPAGDPARASTVARAIGLSPETSAGVPTAIVPADSQPCSAPAVVGRYEVLLRIARGGMGTVYLCRITGEGGFRRLFALKVIRDHLSRNPEYVEMLLQEARIASRLHHPNVVGIVDIGTFADQHYLVMDYVEGCTLSDLLKIHASNRPPHLLVPIMLDALTGLHAAHTLTDDDGSPLTLVHCDVSPQNMLVGTNGVCRITDFGVARAARVFHGDAPGGGEHARVTRGKPAYLSPEQVLGESLDHRSDVFSAGVVLWNALTGSQLFGGDSPEATLRQVLERPIPPPSSAGLRPPACFDKVVLRALQRDRTRRYQSAEEMLIDLRRVAITQDYLAPPSEVATWVTNTFGQQLELRRRAAGIGTPNQDSQPILIGELAPAEAGTPTVEAEESMSHTTVLPPGGFARRREAARSIQRVLILGLSSLAAAVLIIIGLVRPDWIRGGVMNDYGDYVVKERTPVAKPNEDGETEGSDTVALDETGHDSAGVAVEEAPDTDTMGATEASTDTLEPEPDLEIDPDDEPQEVLGKNDPPKRPPGPKPKPQGRSPDADAASDPSLAPTKPPPLAPPDLPDLARSGEPGDDE